MQFQSFHWLSHHGIWAIIPWSTKPASVCVIFWAFLLFCSLVSYILGAFLIKQLFHSRLLDMRWLQPTRRYAPRWLSIISYPTRAHGIISNYWMRLSRIWRILQIKEGVITLSEICRILHILRNPNFNNCFIIHSKYFPVLNGVSPFRSLFFCSPKSQSRPQVFSVNGWIICSGLHFWRHFDVNGWIICSGFHFWRHWLNMTKILPNLVNSSWLWWNMPVVSTNPKRGNILN